MERIGPVNLMAIEEFKKAAEIKPDDASIYVLIGTAYINMNATDAAIEMYKKAIELDPGPESANAYLNLGATYANTKRDYPAALIYLEKYIEVAPNTVQASQVRNNIVQIKMMLAQ